MNIAFLAEPRTWAPLQNLLRWLAPAVTPLRPVAPARPTGGEAKMSSPSRLVQRRPLRVVRIVEAGQGPALVGRMVISGRMADVCAELDRLAACEAAAAR